MKEIEAARLKLKCLEMVEGTELRWKEVVRFKDTKAPIYRELIDYEESSLEFALGIVEGKPVWDGDAIWHKDSKSEYVVDKRFHYLWEQFSWNPPKPKTVMVELPLELANQYALSYTAFPILSEACKKALGEVNGTT